MCLAVPGKILEIKETGELTRSGKVSFGGIVKEINLAYTPEANVGDYVIVHVGFAISTLNEDEANETLKYLSELTEIEMEIRGENEAS